MTFPMSIQSLPIPSPIFPPLVGPFVDFSSREATLDMTKEAHTWLRAAYRGRFSSWKAAYEAAKRVGKGKEPKFHKPHKKGQWPHYHPDVDQVEKLTRKMPSKHDHYYFPPSQYPSVLFARLFGGYLQPSFEREEEDKKENMSIIDFVNSLANPPRSI